MYISDYLKNLHRPGYMVGLLHSYETPDFVVHAESKKVFFCFSVFCLTNFGCKHRFY